MKKILSFCISLFAVIFILPFPVTAEGEIGFVIDTKSYLTEDEYNRVNKEALDAAQEMRMNVIIFICDNVGSDKTDYGVMDFADVTYENLCGKNTDGILLLINLDNDYDYISTSGSAINYFSDSRIDSMFNWFTDSIVRGDYANACSKFINSAIYYYHRGKDNNQVELVGREVDLATLSSILFTVCLFAVFIGLFIFFANQNKYKLQRPTTEGYVVKGSMQLNQNTDTYIQTVVNRVYSPRSSSSGGGGSHHSSTHHSSGGGRHGGGGHHR